MKTYLEIFQRELGNLFVYHGRLSRYDFWVCYFIIFAISILSTLMMMVVPVLSFILFLFQLVTFFMSISIMIRRLHDTNRSGWHCLWMLVPVVNFVLPWLFAAFKGDAVSNKYGSPNW